MITVTEGLAELKTIDARIEKKLEHVSRYAARASALLDPFQADGGSSEMIRKERQAIRDLWERKMAIREAIRQVNERETIDILGTTRTIAGWLAWRREVAPSIKRLHNGLSQKIAAERRNAEGKVYEGEKLDIVCHVDEKQLAADIERLEETLGTLDGKLSLKSATITIDV